MLAAFKQILNKIHGLVLMCGCAGKPLETFHASLDRYSSKTLLNIGIKKYLPKVLQALASNNSSKILAGWKKFLSGEIP